MHNAAVMMDGGGGGSSLLINVDPDEITTIYKYLVDIFNELEANAAPNIEKLAGLQYYTEGKAMKTMEVYPQAIEKINDLYDNYARASTLVTDILQTMITVDQTLAEKIIAKLGV